MQITTSEDAIFAYRAVMTTQAPPHTVAKPLKRILLHTIEASMTVDGREKFQGGIDEYFYSESLTDTIPGVEAADSSWQSTSEPPMLDIREKVAVLKAVEKYGSRTTDPAVKKQTELFLAAHKVSLLGKVIGILVS